MHFSFSSSSSSSSCGHPPSLSLPLLFLSPPSSICLTCFSNLLLHPSSFLSHKTFALSQLSHALHHDPAFSTALLHHHRHLLIPPLSHAIFASHDDSLSHSLMEIVLILCTLDADQQQQQQPQPPGVLHDFLLHLVLQLSSRIVIWSTGQCYTLHLLGLLLESYCKRDIYIPEAIQSHKGFMINLVSGMKFAGDQVRGEILFVLYKLFSLDDGIETLEMFLPNMIPAVVNVLLKTESDELRTNCIALLTTLVQKSVFDIRFQPLDEEQHDQKDGNLNSSVSFSFVRNFAEAIKGSLLSSDSQVQITILQLLCHMCPVEAGIESELQVLIEEGILDYIFEALRTSKNIENLAAWSIRALSLLSAGGSAFKRRFPIGFDTVINVLESSPSTALSAVETDALLLISVGLSDCPGALSVARAEHLMSLLTDRLKQHAGEGFTLIPDIFNSICEALTALLKLPCTSSIQDAVCLVQTAVESAMITISVDGIHVSEVQTFKRATDLLKTSLKFSFDLVDKSAGHRLTEFLSEACREYLLPLFTKYLESLDDEDTIVAVFETLTLVLELEGSDGAEKLTEKVASSSWFNLSFECIAQFPGPRMKEIALTLLRAIVDKLDGCSLEEIVREYLLQLPGDPHDLLVLLEQNNFDDRDLVLTQFAAITILYTSHLCCDRIADDEQILASLEQYLLMNASQFPINSASSTIVRQLLCVYIWTREAVQSCSVPYSIEAEKQLLSLVEQFRYEVVSLRTPKSVLIWLLHKESIRTYMVAAILNWFKSLEEDKSELRTHTLTSFAKMPFENQGVRFFQGLEVFMDLIESDECCATIFTCLLQKVLKNQVDDDIKTVASILTDIARISTLAANQLCKCGLVCDIKCWLALCGSKFPAAMICLIELLFQLLSSLYLEDTMDEDTWLLVANQSVSILLVQLTEARNPICKRVMPHLINFLSLILHKATVMVGSLRKASEAILFSNQLLQIIVANFTRAAKQGSKLSDLDLRSSEGQCLCCSLIFYLSWLKCAVTLLRIKSNDKPSQTGTNEEAAIVSPSVNNLLQKSCMQVEHLCRILYFGTSLLKVLSSSCLVEIFFELVNRGQKQHLEEKDGSQLLSTSIQSVVMVLQGSIFDSNAWLQRNAAHCLYLLINNTGLTLFEQRVVKGSCWYRFLLEELVLSLSSQDPLVGRCISASYLASVAVALLRLSPPPDWMNTVFSSTSITIIISNLSCGRISSGVILLFKELLHVGYLEPDHIRRLQDVFQSARKVIYKRSCDVPMADDDPEKNRHIFCGSSCKRQSSAICLQSDESIINLALSWSLDPYTGLRLCASSDAEPCNLPALVAGIDDFLQESNSYL